MTESTIRDIREIRGRLLLQIFSTLLDRLGLVLSGIESFLSLVLETFVTRIEIEELKSTRFIRRIGKTDHIVLFPGGPAIPPGKDSVQDQAKAGKRDNRA